MQLYAVYEKSILHVLRLKVKGWRKIYHSNHSHEKPEVAMLISEKEDFRARKAIREKKRHYIRIEGPSLQKDITILNTYAPNKR